MLLIYNKQFIISNTFLNLENFIKVHIGNFYLYIDSKTEYKIIEDKDGSKWALVGLAFSADLKNKSPIDDIMNSRSDEIGKKLNNWAGRWCLIGEDSVQSDCVGLMSLYYYQSLKNFYISSSLALLKVIYNPNISIVKNRLIGNHSFDWYPLPLTKYKDIYHLIPSQKIIINNESISVVFRKNVETYEALNDDEIASMIGKHLENTLFNINLFSKKNLHLALTGGADSRTLLAILLNQKIPFKSYLLYYNLITKADKKIPFTIAKKFGFKHSLIRGKATNKTRLTLFDTHTDYNLNDGNRLFFAKKQFDQFTEDDLLIKGAIFELGKGFYYSTFFSSENVKSDLYKAFPDIEFVNGYKKSLDCWFDWVKQHPLNIDLRDRLYLEQRNSGWIGALEQGLDILDSHSIHPANSALVVSLLLSLSEKSKFDGDINLLIIKEYEESLLNYAINPKDKLRMLKYMLVKFKKHPISTMKKGLRYIKIKYKKKENKNDINREIKK